MPPTFICLSSLRLICLSTVRISCYLAQWNRSSQQPSPHTLTAPDRRACILGRRGHQEPHSTATINTPFAQPICFLSTEAASCPRDAQGWATTAARRCGPLAHSADRGQVIYPLFKHITIMCIQCTHCATRRIAASERVSPLLLAARRARKDVRPPPSPRSRPVFRSVRPFIHSYLFSLIYAM